MGEDWGLPTPRPPRGVLPKEPGRPSRGDGPEPLPLGAGALGRGGGGGEGGVAQWLWPQIPSLGLRVGLAVIAGT